MKKILVLEDESSIRSFVVINLRRICAVAVMNPSRLLPAKMPFAAFNSILTFS